MSNQRDYKSTPVSDALGIRGVIDGLATDLQELRDGKISPVEAMARAHLAKQFFNGARLVLLAMKEIQPPTPPKDIIRIDAGGGNG